MHKVQEDLLRVVSDTLWKKSSDHIYSEIDWEGILTLAEEQGVLFLVLQGCPSVRMQMSGANWLKWRSKLVSTMVNNDSLMATQSKLVETMTDNGIPCAILKGASLASCYYNPLARAMGDIDLLVAPQYSQQAVDILLGQGFTAPKESFEHPYHIDFYRNNTVVELHYAVSTFPDSTAGATAKRLMESCWQEIRQKNIAGHTFPCLSDFHQALSLLLHMQRHMTTGCIGLRQLCDWAVFVKSVPPELYESRILPELEHCGLAEFARVLTKTSVRYLGLELDDAFRCRSVSDRIVEAMIDEILRAGNITNRHNTDDTSSFFVEASGKETAVRVYIRKINAVARRKFPVTKQVPLLLPLFWVYLPVRYWLRSLAGMRKRKSVMCTVSVTKQRKRLYRELKLFNIDERK